MGVKGWIFFVLFVFFLAFMRIVAEAANEDITDECQDYGKALKLAAEMRDHGSMQLTAQLFVADAFKHIDERIIYHGTDLVYEYPTLSPERALDAGNQACFEAGGLDGFLNPTS